ncbi:SUKH-4 family immunity protein [Micromonospora sp. NPDC005686]|uniref:SUKH-4 family immunity protein n=1 Tax=unclassified Micromonospora TaxID=2617518 RepID=UPI0033B06FD9
MRGSSSSTEPQAPSTHGWRGRARLINSKLDIFVEFLRRIQLEINSFEEQGGPEEERTDGYVQRLLREIQEVDPEPFPQARSSWETILKAIFV